jgi:hypothetical protein
MHSASLLSLYLFSLSLLLSRSFPGTVSISLPTEWRFRSKLSTDCIRLRCSLSSRSLDLSLLLALALSECVPLSLPTEGRLRSMNAFGSSAPCLFFLCPLYLSLLLTLSLLETVLLSLYTEWRYGSKLPIECIRLVCSLSLISLAICLYFFLVPFLGLCRFRFPLNYSFGASSRLNA